MKKQQPESPEQLELLFPSRESPALLARRGPMSVVDGGAPETSQTRSAARSKEAQALRAEMAARRAQGAASAGAPARPGLRVIQGGGQKSQEKLGSRDAVVRVLIEAGADMLLKRISADRAEHIEQRVNKILDLFDQVDESPALMPVLQRQLDDLEALMGETRGGRSRRQG